MDAVNRLAEQGSYGENGDLVNAFLVSQRDGIHNHHFLHRTGCQPVNSGTGENGMSTASIELCSPPLLQDAKGGHHRPCGIDLIIHDTGDATRRRDLTTWLEGWSQSLAEMNYLRTGYQCPDGLLDLHFVTDIDVARRTSYAMKIDAITDAARELPLVDPTQETSED